VLGLSAEEALRWCRGRDLERSSCLDCVERLGGMEFLDLLRGAREREGDRECRTWRRSGDGESYRGIIFLYLESDWPVDRLGRWNAVNGGSDRLNVRIVEAHREDDLARSVSRLYEWVI
jgi:hypothetical protein